jgi:hypothetical protein
MTASDFNHFRRALISAVIGVIISAIVTGFVFYFSSTASIQEILRTLERHQNSINSKVDKREFDRHRYDTDKREAVIDRKFESIDHKLDKIIDFQLNTRIHD